MSDPEVGDEFEIEVLRLGVDGEGVGQIDGYTVFVQGALPSERVRARLTERKRRFGRAVVVDRVTSSPKRVAAICPLFERCGGCQLMHLDYSEQLVVKRQRVVDALERIGKISGANVAPCRPSPNPLYYRNKIQLPVQGGAGLLGLYAKGSHDVVPIERCFIHCALGEEAFQTVRSLLPVDGLRHVLIKTAVNQKQVLVVLIVSEVTEAIEAFAHKIYAGSDAISGVCALVNTREDNVVIRGAFQTLVGADAIEEELDGLKFKVSPASFFQVNTAQAELLYRRAIELAGLRGEEVVLDAYCGVGTLSLFAARQAGEVLGVECVEAAIVDARENAKVNGITNAHFTCALAEKYIAGLERVDVALLNPPRKGCDPRVIEKLITLRPKTIVYISCDPATLARDLALLQAGGYGINQVEPFDMFPQTAHVETLVKVKDLRG